MLPYPVCPPPLCMYRPETQGVRPRVSPYIVEVCRQFRRHPTSTEEIVWKRLQNRQLCGFKFRRQHHIGRYISDFYCHEHRSLIEVDGAIHMKQDQRLYDAARQEDIEAQGYRVMRITTKGVEQDLSGVVGKIIDTLKVALPRPRRQGMIAMPEFGRQVTELLDALGVAI